MDLSNPKHNLVTSFLSSSKRIDKPRISSLGEQESSLSKMNSVIPMPQDYQSMDYQNEFLGIFANENELDCPYSEVFPIIVPQNEDDYFADNALMDMFKDAPLIQQIRSQENSQKDHHQDSNTQKAALDSDGVKSEQFMSEAHSSTTNTKSTLTYHKSYLKDQRSPTPPETFSHSQQLNSQISSPANKRQKVSSVNQFNCLNTPEDYGNTIRSDNFLYRNQRTVASDHFNVNQGTYSSVQPTRGCKCIKTSCSNGRCPCYQAKVGCSSKICGCQECKNSNGRRNGSDRTLPNTTVRIENQRAIHYQLPQPTPSQFRPSSSTQVDQSTQRASSLKLFEATPVQYHQSFGTWVYRSTQRASYPSGLLKATPAQVLPSSDIRINQSTQRASSPELLKATPMQFRPSSHTWVNHEPQRAFPSHELLQDTPLQFRPSPYSSVQPTQGASLRKLPQQTPPQHELDWQKKI